MIKTSTLVIIGGTVLAIYLYSSQGKDEEGFEKGFLAGWVTPGPVTIAAVVIGGVYFLR